MSLLHDLRRAERFRRWFGKARRGPRLRVALATSDGVHVDVGIESARSVVLFAITAEEARFTGVLGISEPDPAEPAAMLALKRELLRSFDLVIGVAEGPAPTSSAARSSLRSMRLAAAAPIALTVQKLQSELNAGLNHAG